MARGGPRQGNPGQAYRQRRDLNKQPLKAVPNQPYGQAGQQIAAQRAVPIPDNNQPPPPPQPIGNPGPAPTGELGNTGGPAMMLPGDFGAFDRGSERPNEPVTAGLAANDPSMSEMMPSETPAVTELRAMFLTHPTPGLGRLIELMQR